MGLMACTLLLFVLSAATLKINNYLSLETRLNSPSFQAIIGAISGKNRGIENKLLPMPGKKADPVISFADAPYVFWCISGNPR
jgi:hypothetical protein